MNYPTELDEFLECYIDDPEACEEENDVRIKTLTVWPIFVIDTHFKISCINIEYIFSLARTPHGYEQGRQHLSEALLVQGEMVEHEIYMEQGNNMFPVDAANAVERPPMNDISGDHPQNGAWREEGGEYWGDLRP